MPLGWEAFVYRGSDPDHRDLLASWTTSVVGVDWIDLLVEQGLAEDRGGNGYPCIYTATAGALLPPIAGRRLAGRAFPASVVPPGAIFPSDLDRIVWDAEQLRLCRADDELVVHLFDRS